MKLEINHRKRSEKNKTNKQKKITWSLNNMLLKTYGSMMKSKRKIKNTLRQMTMKTHHTKSIGCSKSSSQREANSNIGFPQKTRKMSNKQPNLSPKRIRKRTSKT